MEQPLLVARMVSTPVNFLHLSFKKSADMTTKRWIHSLLMDLTYLALGIALTFAFAPYELFPLAVVVPLILLALWLKQSAKQAFWKGFLFGVGFFGAGVHWVYISVHDLGDVPAPLAFLITTGMTFILALYPALTGYCLNRFFRQTVPSKLLCAFPALWVGFEWARSILLSGFAWLILGYSQTNSPLSGYAAILSVYGVSLFTLLTSALLLNSFFSFKAKQYATLIIQLIAIVGIWSFGWGANHIPWTRSEQRPVRIALIQGAIPQAVKWSQDNLLLSIKRYQSMTAPLWGKVDIIIWPETAIPMTIQDAAPLINQLDEKARETRTTLITGIPVYVPNKNGYHNSIVTLGDYTNVYSKRHLVPFGEYVPFGPYVHRFLNFMNIPTSDIVPGEVNQGPLLLGDLKIGASICYEITFPEEIRTTDPDIGLLLTLTNDAWFGKSNAQAQHLQMAQMRALELNRPVIIASNDGITAIINHTGEVQSIVPPYTISVLNSSVQARHGLTPWMKNGMGPIIFILLVMLAVAYIKNLARARQLQIETVTPN